ncbi:MAG: helix-turn-helix domain-containing protein [Marivibrio sp.]|uniref:TetR/AcrR family transcriptional regulator n=1 Tax=Marivibrio sp. TaxID=2039719 RepID=UPI0032ECE6A9
MRGKKKSDRAVRLTLAAQRLFHRSGVGAVSLRDVAAAARVPAGGVFYHFPTKARLVLAAAEARRAAATRLLEGLRAAHPDDPEARFAALAAALAETAPVVARYGCPVMRMIADLAGATGEERKARALLQDGLAEVEAFAASCLREAGRSAPAARRGAGLFLQDWQGASALSLARGDPGMLRDAMAAAPGRMPPPRRRGAPRGRRPPA